MATKAPTAFAIEQVCHKLYHQVAQGLRLDFNRFLKLLIHPSLTSPRQNARLYNNLKGKKEDNSYSRQEAAIVVMDKQNVINIVKNLLEQPAYRSIPLDPTNKYKAKLINNLIRIEKESCEDDTTYIKNVPNRGLFSLILWSSNITKGHHLRSRVLNRDSVTYGGSKKIDSILQPLVGKSTLYMKHTGPRRTNHEHYTKTRGIPNILLYHNSLHTSPSQSKPQHITEEIRTRCRTATKDQTHHIAHYGTSRVLPS